MKDVLVKIPVPSETKTIFYKARPVPYAIKEKVENELLECLVKEGIFEPLEYSEWAVPTVPVQKSDGSVRICGDYQVTVNKVTQCDKYPVSRTEDLERFSKLDLSHAYQLLVLEEDSRKYRTVNIHKSLVQPTRLRYGIHSVAGISQREMERRLSHVAFTVSRMDDILISGKDDNEHFQNLESVLDIGKKNLVCDRKRKNVFSWHLR